MELENFEQGAKLELENCLKRFPEIENVELMIEWLRDAKEIAAVKGHREEKTVLVLIVPLIFLEKNASPSVLRPFIYHELSHIIDKENPDRIFFERADEHSQRLWRLLQDTKTLNCIVGSSFAKATEDKEE